MVRLLRHTLDLAEDEFNILIFTEKCRNLLEEVSTAVATSANIVGTVVHLKKLALVTSVQLQYHLQRIMAFLADRLIHLLYKGAQLGRQCPLGLLDRCFSNELLPKLYQRVIDLDDFLLGVLCHCPEEAAHPLVEIPHKSRYRFPAKFDNEPKVVLGLAQLRLLDHVIHHRQQLHHLLSQVVVEYGHFCRVFEMEDQSLDAIRSLAGRALVRDVLEKPVHGVVVGQRVQHLRVVGHRHPLDEALKNILVVNSGDLPSSSSDLVEPQQYGILLGQQLSLSDLPVLLVDDQSRVIHLDRQALQHFEVVVEVFIMLRLRWRERLEKGLQLLLAAR